MKMDKADEITFRTIGIIHSPFKEAKGVPIQPSAAEGVEGEVEVFPEYEEGLEDIGKFSHIFLIYHLHLIRRARLKVKPYMDDEERGVFATRAPSRPNPIGISVVELLEVEGNILHIKNVDIVDGTPLLDIKPYVPQFDTHEVKKIGWLEKKVHKLPETKDDGRFI
jgi:tRNA-Thr(GGU) m(6)t(6)A37 methyltransferase TsaA